jgi:hypothetical protein
MLLPECYCPETSRPIMNHIVFVLSAGRADIQTLRTYSRQKCRCEAKDGTIRHGRPEQSLSIAEWCWKLRHTQYSSHWNDGFGATDRLYCIVS